MTATDTIRLGIVGASGRGGYFKKTCDAIDNVAIHAVCDINEEGLAGTKEALGANEAYLDYDEMLEKAGLDAVLVGTPMQFHVPQSVAALERKNVRVVSLPDFTEGQASASRKRRADPYPI